MSSKGLKRFWLALGIILLVIAADQFLKVWIKHHLYFGEERNVIGTWFRLHHTVNNGMAFGIEIMKGPAGKLFLTFFRLILVGFGFWFLWSRLKEKSPLGLIISVALIIAGAIGNVIDSIFYGVIFNEGTWFQGKVVDMLYFPLWEGHLPNWIPGWGGDEFVFFSPVFNLADASISTGVIAILIWQKRFFAKANPFISASWNDNLFEKNTADASAWFKDNKPEIAVSLKEENIHLVMGWLKDEVNKELKGKKTFFSGYSAQKLYAFNAFLGEYLLSIRPEYQWVSSEWLTHQPLEIQRSERSIFPLEERINQFLFDKNDNTVVEKIAAMIRNAPDEL